MLPESHVRISVILPTYNGARFITRAIQSIIAQTLTDWELLVVDDGSTDNTAVVAADAAARDRRVRYIKNEKNVGVQKSLNRGLREARGEYIARIDDDDEWIDVEKLKKQTDFLDAHSDYVLAGTGVIVVDETKKELFRFRNPETDGAIRQRMLSRNCFTHSSVMFRRKDALACGGYDESPETLHAEDYDLWLKLGTAGKLANLPFYGLRFTERAGMSNRHRSAQFRNDFYLLKKYRMQYPNYWFALVTNLFRISLWRFYRFLPQWVKKSLFPFYKKYWGI